jgi:hypothetical protein
VWLRRATWLIACALAVLLVAWLSFTAQYFGFAPVGVLPAACGAAVGGAVVLAAGALGLKPGGRCLVAAAALWALLAVVAQDYIGFRQHNRGWKRTASQHPALRSVAERVGGERGFPEFFARRVAERPWLWGLDAGLSVAAAAAMAAALSRKTDR